MNLKQYMEHDDKNKDFFGPWESVFEGMGAQEVLFCSSSYWGYGGSIDIDILLSDGRVLSYGYAFDSCCDRLEGSCDDGEETEIIEDVEQHATYFDDLAQYDAWVDTLPDNIYRPYGEDERKIFRRKHRHES